MTPMTSRLLGAVALAGAAALAGFSAARAAGPTCTAFIGGVETAKTIVPELVVLNTAGADMTLDLVLRNAAGQAIVTLPAAVAVPARQTVFVDLQEKLKTAGLNGKPYVGLFAVELTGEAPFGADAAVVHVTQYFGSRRKPKAAFTLRPLFPPAVN
jgi:hypothetical protein